MVGILTSMKFAMLRHSPAGMRRAGWVIGAVFVAATWAAGVFAAGSEVRAEVLMLLFVCWGVAAALGPVTMSGPGVLRADYFILLPLDRSKLALGLLGAVFPGIASGYVLLAFLSLLLHAAQLSAASVLVALVAAPLAWVITITISRLVYAALGSAMRSWLGVEISAIQFGFMIGGLLAGWMVIVRGFQSVPILLASGLPDGTVVTVLSVLPTSWPIRAVEAVAAGDVSGTTRWVLALAVLAVVLLGLAAILLRPHLGDRRSRVRRRPLGSRVLSRPGLLPDTMFGAVIGKELRQWWRDPWRKLELRTGLYTGLVIGAFCFLSVDYRLVAPLSGLVIVFMVCLSGCNMYGQDGSAVWLTVVGERTGTVRADVRGRQIAMLLLFVPPAIVVSIILVLITGEHWAWPAIAAGLPALFGVASGVAIVFSVVAVSPGVDPRRRVGPNDAGGDLSLQASLAVWITLILVTPTTAAVVFGYASALPWAPALAVLVGLVNGGLGFWLLGRLTIGYLSGRLPVVFTRIRYGRTDNGNPAGVIGWLESQSQIADDKALAAKEKEKADRARGRAAVRG